MSILDRKIGEERKKLFKEIDGLIYGKYHQFINYEEYQKLKGK